MSRKKEIDAIDIDILNLLQRQGDMPNKELAKRIGLTEGPTNKRVQNLKRKGYILGAQAKINLEKLGYEGNVAILISTTKENSRVMGALLASCPYITKVFEMRPAKLTNEQNFYCEGAYRTVDTFKTKFEYHLKNVDFLYSCTYLVIEKKFKEDLGVQVSV